MSTKNIINLNQLRKHKKRQDKRTQGDLNAVKYGRSKAAKQAELSELKRSSSWHESHKLEKE